MTYRKYLVRREEPESTTVAEWATHASKWLHCMPLQVSLWLRISMIGLRYFTFEILGLKHTCESKYKWLTNEEIEEIQDEDKEKLKTLEELMEQFELEFNELQHTEDGGNPFTSFLMATWAPRMEQVLRDMELRNLTLQELRESEEAGVVWDVSPPEAGIELDPVRDVEYWMTKLDEIAPSQMTLR